MSASAPYRGFYLPETLNGTTYADPRLGPGLDTALNGQVVTVTGSGRTLFFRLEFTDGAGQISRADPGTCTIEIYRARPAPMPRRFEWAEFVPARTSAPGQRQFWDATPPGSYTFRVTTIAGATGTHYRLYVEEQQ